MAEQLPASAQALAAGFPVEIPFLLELGLTHRSLGIGQSELILDMQHRHTNSYMALHGGAVMTMLDVAMAMAARSLKDEQQRLVNEEARAAGKPMPRQFQGYVTIEMKTSFLIPAKGQLRAQGRVAHATNSMAFCEADLFMADGRIAAKANGTFKAIMSRPQPSATDG
jgi:acyl-coenzyme A thioesterase PaaI-like protein